jgi:putative sugar O-methyltransferase
MSLNRASLIEFIRNLAQGKLIFLADLYLNTNRAWRFMTPMSESDSKASSTSLSDEYVYDEFCRVASVEIDVYKKFRSCAQYQQILEHVSRSLGQKYLVMVCEADNLGMDIKELVSDDIGRPFRYTYKGAGRVSPTQLRYSKVLSDLITHFGTLDNLEIVEVGVGYGGQASQICKKFAISGYAMVDLPSVLLLAERYVRDRVSGAPLCTLKSPKNNEKGYDLFISNYAFSELKPDIQEQYFKDYVSTSKRGYVIYNDITPPEWGSMSAIDLASRIPGSIIIDEIPKTGARNVLIIWGHNK